MNEHNSRVALLTLEFVTLNLSAIPRIDSWLPKYQRLIYTIDIQKREDANRCSSYVELVVPNYTFNEFRQHFRLTRAIFETIKQQIMILFSGTMK
jgi:hypothetical protein